MGERTDWPAKDYHGDIDDSEYRLEAVRYGFPNKKDNSRRTGLWSSQSSMPILEDIVKHLDQFPELRAAVLNHYSRNGKFAEGRVVDLENLLSTEIQLLWCPFCGIEKGTNDVAEHPHYHDCEGAKLMDWPRALEEW